MLSERSFVKIISWLFYILAFITPLIFTSVNYELFEFNKMMAVYLFGTLISVFWLGRMISARRFIWKNTPLTPFVVLFLLSQLISTWFSMDRHTSIWGYYSRSHGGLLSSLCYSLLFFAYVSNVEKTKNYKIPGIIVFMLGSAVLVAGYGILEHFGIDKNLWVQDVQNRVFSTLGQPNWLAAYLVSLIFIPISLFFSKNIKVKNKVILAFVSLLFYTAVVFSKSKSGLAAFWAGCSMLFLLSSKSLKQKRSWLYLLAGVLLFAFTTFVFYPDLSVKIKKVFFPAKTTHIKTLPSGAPVRTGGSSTGQIRQVVWKGALNVWRHFPLFGSGNETFAYSYYNFRPVEHNNNSEWDFLYNKAHNEYLNFLACTGFIGLSAVFLLQLSFPFYLLWPKNRNIQNVLLLIMVPLAVLALNPGSIFSPIYQKLLFYPPIVQPLGASFLLAYFLLWLYFRFIVKKQVKITRVDIGLLCAYFAIMLSNFYGFSVVIIGLFTFLFPAISISLHSHDGESNPPKSSLDFWQKLGLGTLGLFGLYFSLIIYNLWNADRFFAKGKALSDSEQYLAAFEPLVMAEGKNTGEPLYKAEMAEEAANLAYYYSQSEGSESASLTKDLTSLAVDKALEALSISPYHINYYKSLAKIYLTLASIEPGYTTKSIEALQTAAKLSPTDPKLLVNIALLQKQEGKTEEAEKNLQKAIELKPDYDHAYVYLARLYKENNEDEKAKKIYRALLDNFYPPNKEAEEYLGK